MANDTTLPGTNDVIRDVQKGTPKTQVVILDRGGSGTEDVGTLGDAANGIDVDVTRVQGSVAVTGTFFQATQPVSGTVTATTPIPAAAALADAAANPTTPTVGADLLLYNGTTWDRARGTTANGLAADVTRVVPGTAATNLGKAIATAAGATDTGVASLLTRQDAPVALSPAAGAYASPEISNLGQQWVVQARPKRVKVASGGLTTATNPYTAGNQVGTQFTFAGAAIATGGGGYIESIQLFDEKAIIGQYTVWLFRSTVTPATDRTAFALSDADTEALIGDPISLGPVRSGTNNFTSGWYGSIPYDTTTTSIFALLQTNAAHTFFTAVTDLQLAITMAVLG